MNDEDLWPRTGDVLFSSDGGVFNACVQWTSDQWIGYIEGYRRAGDLLARHVADEVRDQDYLVYPLVFLFRHAIEVSLKRLICLGLQFKDRDQEIPKHHRLVALWEQARQITEDVWPDGGKDELNAAGKILSEFERHDQASTAFRYPVTEKGEALRSGGDSIDILNFAVVAGKVLSLLDGCGTELSNHLQYKLETERDRE